MSAYLVRRVLYMLLLLWLVTVVAFTIIQLPQGDFVSSLAVRLAEQGETVTQELLDGLRRRYGLDRPMHVQYLKWFGNVLRGDFGFSFYVNRPVSDVIGERLALTVLISICSLAFSYGIGIPVGIYSATHQYRFGDYLFMAVGFIGLATPNFLLALVLMFAALGNSPVPVRRLPLHGGRFHRSGHAEFPARAGADVCRPGAEHERGWSFRPTICAPSGVSPSSSTCSSTCPCR